MCASKVNGTIHGSGAGFSHVGVVAASLCNFNQSALLASSNPSAHFVSVPAHPASCSPECLSGNEFVELCGLLVSGTGV